MVLSFLVIYFMAFGFRWGITGGENSRHTRDSRVPIQNLWGTYSWIEPRILSSKWLANLHGNSVNVDGHAKTGLELSGRLSKRSCRGTGWC